MLEHRAREPVVAAVAVPPAGKGCLGVDPVRPLRDRVAPAQADVVPQHLGLWMDDRRVDLPEPMAGALDEVDRETPAPGTHEAKWSRREAVVAGREVADILADATAALAPIESWETGEIETALRGMIEEKGLGMGKALQPIRVAVTGSSVSPPLFESLAALGKERSLQRVERAREMLG